MLRALQPAPGWERSRLVARKRPTEEPSRNPEGPADPILVNGFCFLTGPEPWERCERVPRCDKWLFGKTANPPDHVRHTDPTIAGGTHYGGRYRLAYSVRCVPMA